MRYEYKKITCAECGKVIKHPYYISGKAYGYNCYKQKIAMLYKQFEDEKNKEYSIKCFAAMEVFKDKKSNNFHDSICRQWGDCKKLTAKQLNCIINGFTDNEKIDFYIVWCLMTEDECLKRSIPTWIQSLIKNRYKDYIDNEIFISCMLCDRKYKKYGFHFLHDIEDEPELVFIMENGKDDKILKENAHDEYYEILKVVDPEKRL